MIDFKKKIVCIFKKKSFVIPLRNEKCFVFYHSRAGLEEERG